MARTTKAPPTAEQLAEFIDSNPEANYRQEGEHFIVGLPWGDPTIELRITTEQDAVIEALNSVQLPTSLSALWHRDTLDLEFIYGPLPANSELRQRTSQFNFEGEQFTCSYGNASSRLLAIAAVARMTGHPSETGHRNLLPLQFFHHLQEKNPTDSITQEIILTSFWIRNVKWDEERIIKLARHLNFYMHFFDRQTPHIIIHEEPTVSDRWYLPVRYPCGPFPSTVRMRVLDAHLLRLWERAVSGDPFSRFLHGYQVLEYAAFYFLQDKVLQNVRRILVAPETPVDPHEAAKRICDAMVADKLQQDDKIRAVVQQLVSVESLWKEIEPNRDYFAEEVRFEGGFVVPALIDHKWEVTDFEKSWHPKFPDNLRQLRNALVHARYTSMDAYITPTRRNYELLQPWLALLSVTVSQVILGWHS